VGSDVEADAACRFKTSQLESVDGNSENVQSQLREGRECKKNRNLSARWRGIRPTKRPKNVRCNMSQDCDFFMPRLIEKLGR
jgi:hypothetical protein